MVEATRREIVSRQGPIRRCCQVDERPLRLLALSAGKSRMFFGLRSGVELFVDSTMPEAVARAKEAAVLYDEVVFEPELYEVSISECGSMEMWTPPEALTDEMVAQSRRVQSPGTNFSVAIGPDGRDAAFSVMDSPQFIVTYASEYYTGILDKLADFSPDWVKLATLGISPFPINTVPGELSGVVSNAKTDGMRCSCLKIAAGRNSTSESGSSRHSIRIP